jgi:hypothetical protein
MNAFILAETVDERWRPGIGDPTVIGWVTVVAYLIATVACCRASYHTRLAGGRWSFFWVSTTLVMTFLCVNKQLDLQTLLTEIGRDYFKAHNIYEQRRVYQVTFIGCVAAICTVAMFVSFLRMRRDLGLQWPTVVGIIFLMGFVIIRAASFHHVDAFLAATIGGLKWNWILELSGIALIAAGAWRVPSRTKDPE